MKRYPLVVFGVAASSDSPAPYSMREGRAQQAQAGVEIRQRADAAGTVRPAVAMTLALSTARGVNFGPY